MNELINRGVVQDIRQLLLSRVRRLLLRLGTALTSFGGFDRNPL